MCHCGVACHLSPAHVRLDRSDRPPVMKRRHIIVIPGVQVIEDRCVAVVGDGDQVLGSDIFGVSSPSSRALPQQEWSSDVSMGKVIRVEFVLLCLRVHPLWLPTGGLAVAALVDVGSCLRV